MMESILKTGSPPPKTGWFFLCPPMTSCVFGAGSKNTGPRCLLDSTGWQLPHPTTPQAPGNEWVWLLVNERLVTGDLEQKDKKTSRVTNCLGRCFFFIGQLTRWWFFAIVALSLLLFTYVQSHIVLLGQVKRYFA